MITYKKIKENMEIRNYIEKGDEMLGVIGYTEHSLAHVTNVAITASGLLWELGYEERICDLAAIAGYMHDIGNVINRVSHAQSGALMSFEILNRLGMSSDNISIIIAAIGNHDEHTAMPVSAVTAALILADKSDVRRTRVRNEDITKFDIHDRVNYSAENAKLTLDTTNRTVALNITIDTEICPVMDYFEIFIGRMILSRKAAAFLDLKFELIINGTRLL